MTKSPRLIGVGKNPLKLDRLLLCIEGEILIDVTLCPMETSFFTLYFCYYIFSISYPNECKDLFFFVDSVLLGLYHKATNRISVQNFTKAVNTYLD